MTNESLTYALIEQKIDQYVKNVVDDKPGSVERVAMLVAFVPLIPLLLVVQFVKSLIGLRLIEVSVGIVVLAMVIVVVCNVRREWRTFHRRHDSAARKLDGEYGQWRDLVAAMRRFPRAELARRLRYLSARRSTLTYKMGLFTGSVQRLGVLPLLAILYLQFKTGASVTGGRLASCM